jgi:hypothetical protein
LSLIGPELSMHQGHWGSWAKEYLHLPTPFLPKKSKEFACLIYIFIVLLIPHFAYMIII